MIVEKLHSIKSKTGWQINILPSHQRKVSFQLYTLLNRLAHFGLCYDNAYINKINPKLATMILGASTQTCVALLSKHIRSFVILTSKLVKKIVNYINEKRWQSLSCHLTESLNQHFLFLDLGLGLSIESNNVIIANPIPIPCNTSTTVCFAEKQTLPIQIVSQVIKPPYLLNNMSIKILIFVAQSKSKLETNIKTLQIYKKLTKKQMEVL